MSVSFCLLHPVAVSDFINCRGMCVCTELRMCVLYESFGSKVRPINFGCVVMCGAVLFILMSRLLVYSAGSVVNKVQVVLPGFSARLFCFDLFCPGQNCMYVWLYVFLCYTCGCVCRCDGDVIWVCHDLNRCSGWW